MNSSFSPMADPTEVPEAPELGESELAPLLAAWDLAHPAADHPDWRHLLDEMTRPRTTQAFHRLAVTAGS